MNEEILEAAKVCSRGGLACYGCEYRLASEHVMECTGRFARAITEHHNKYRWHDLRKDPNDLPTDNSIGYLAIGTWYDGDATYEVVTGNYIKSNNDKAYCITAWREIEPVESEE